MAAPHRTAGLWIAAIAAMSAAVNAFGYVGGSVAVAGVEVDVLAREQLGVQEVERMKTMNYRAEVC